MNLVLNPFLGRQNDIVKTPEPDIEITEYKSGLTTGS